MSARFFFEFPTLGLFIPVEIRYACPMNREAENGPAAYEQVLRAGCFLPRLAAETKGDVIVELLDALVSAGNIRDRDDALHSILDREAVMSTGLQDGIAMPHGRTDQVAAVTLALGLKPEGVDFEALDGNPSQIFVLTLSPLLYPQAHLAFLSRVGGMLTRSGIRDKLLQVTTKEDAVTILTDIREGVANI